jgi:hypothetical protein
MTNLNAQRLAMTTPEDRPQTDIAMSDLDWLRVGRSRGQGYVIAEVAPICETTGAAC